MESFHTECVQMLISRGKSQFQLCIYNSTLYSFRYVASVCALCICSKHLKSHCSMKTYLNRLRYYRTYVKNVCDPAPANALSSFVQFLLIGVISINIKSNRQIDYFCFLHCFSHLITSICNEYQSIKNRYAEK